MVAKAANLDFSNVKEGGNFNKRRIPAGDYLATITKVEDAVAKDETAQYLFTIKINKHPGSLLPYYCKLQENQLWKLRNIFIAAGKTVPKKRQRVDPNQLVNKTVGVTVEDAEWDGKDQSEIAGIFPAAELDDSQDDDVADVDEAEEDESLDDAEAEVEAEDEAEEPEDEAEVEADPYADLDRTALKAELKSRDASFVAKKSQTDDDLRDLLRASDGAGEDAEAEPEDDEEEEAPAPVVKKKVGRPAAKKAPAAEVSDEDLEDIDIDDL